MPTSTFANGRPAQLVTAVWTEVAIHNSRPPHGPTFRIRVHERPVPAGGDNSPQGDDAGYRVTQFAALHSGRPSAELDVYGFRTHERVDLAPDISVMPGAHEEIIVIPVRTASDYHCHGQIPVAAHVVHNMS